MNVTRYQKDDCQPMHECRLRTTMSSLNAVTGSIEFMLTTSLSITGAEPYEYT